MKIPLRFFGNAGDEEIVVGCRVLTAHVSGTMDFIIDTGSPRTFIGLIDCQKLGIKIKAPSDKDVMQWADKKLHIGKTTHPLKLTFIAEEDNQEKAKTLNVGRMDATTDFITMKGNKDSPSIIGLDFLMINKMRLCVDGASKKAWFELQ
ncbi:MAG: hypothetical protein WC613_03980 [Candidatus Aenigmatarchaeota archaeon]